MGIEPPGSAWKADVLPLNYTRTPLEAKSQWHRTLFPAGGGGRIRTYEGISQQIYSLPPLAAWVPLLKMSRVFCGAGHVVHTYLRDSRDLSAGSGHPAPGVYGF